MNRLYELIPSLYISPAPPGNGDLNSFVKWVRKKNISILVSLVSPMEMTELGLRDLFVLCEENGISHIHFPIRDFEVPSDMDAATELARELNDHIKNGQKVMIHCKGGIGRSSILASAILILAGYSSDDAVKQISSGRGCEVPETEEQRKWITEFEKSSKEKRDR